MSDYQRGPAPGDFQRRSNEPATPEQVDHWLAECRAALQRTVQRDGDAELEETP